MTINAKIAKNLMNGLRLDYTDNVHSAIEIPLMCKEMFYLTKDPRDNFWLARLGQGWATGETVTEAITEAAIKLIDKGK